MLTEGAPTTLIQSLIETAEYCASQDKILPGEVGYDSIQALRDVTRNEAVNLQRPFRLGVVGMFKSGKSSVLNTFLRRKVLREGRTEATSVLTELRFAESQTHEKGVVEYVNGESEVKTVQETLEYTDIRSNIFFDLSEEAKRAKQESIKSISLELHCDILRSMNLVDTPGFGGSKVGDRKALQALQGVDAALIVFPADRIGAAEELEVADALSRANREIVALLNKVDNDKGASRSEPDLAEPERFLRANFQTLVRGKDNQALIFRYSAKEVQKALDILHRPDVTPAEAETAARALEKWGYRPSGESETQRGVIEFLRTRYFSEGQETYRRKQRQALNHVSGLFKTLLGKLDDGIEKLAIEIQAMEDKSTEGYREQSEFLENRIEQIEREIEQLIEDRLAIYHEQLQGALESLIESRTQLDLSSLADLARSDEELAARAREEFKEAFPEWMTTDMIEDLQRRLQNLMRRQWKLVGQELASNPKLGLELVDPGVLLQEANEAIRLFAVAIGAYLATQLVTLFIPGGQILALIQIAALGFGFYETEKHQAAINDAKRKARRQVDGQIQKIRGELQRQAFDANHRLADLEREKLEGKFRGHSEALAAASNRRSRHRDARSYFATRLIVLEQIAKD